MEENFFIEEPEKLENNFFNKELKEDFQKNFKAKSEEMVKVLSKKNRHAKKIKKRQKRTQQEKTHVVNAQAHK